jgi:ubiquitin-protein ligase E3 A
MLCQVGTVLGLAIYNGVLLDVRFPMAVYKKLLDFKVPQLSFEF